MFPESCDECADLREGTNSAIASFELSFMRQGGSGSAAQLAALQKNVAEQDQRCTELEVCLQARGTQASYSYVLQALVCSVCTHRILQVTMSDQGMQCTVSRSIRALIGWCTLSSFLFTRSVLPSSLVWLGFRLQEYLCM